MMCRILFFAILSISVSGIRGQFRTAIAHLESETISGSITFTETADGRVRVTGTLSGHQPGHYGFHVHELGDISTCDTTGAHYNPDGNTHGGRDHSTRHVGDLGNIQFNSNNISNVDFVDDVITLEGRNSILGRALVLHAEEDDLGLGGVPASLTTGNAGARVACGVIGIHSPAGPWNAASGITLKASLLFFSLLLVILKY